MINTVNQYRLSGYNAGIAVRRNDMSLDTFEREWFRSALALESDDDRIIARQEWTAGYAQAQPSRFQR
jgi:hypothetical protein